jgi:hypothetical protein
MRVVPLLALLGLACCGGKIEALENSGSVGVTGSGDGDHGTGDAGTLDSVCTLSPDCGTSTVQGCGPNLCPNNGACILFLPKGTYSEYGTKCTVSSCMTTCGSSSDCSDGYECVSPRSAPWNGFAIILDDNQEELVCLPSSCDSQ